MSSKDPGRVGKLAIKGHLMSPNAYRLSGRAGSASMGKPSTCSSLSERGNSGSALTSGQSTTSKLVSPSGNRGNAPIWRQFKIAKHLSECGRIGRLSMAMPLTLNALSELGRDGRLVKPPQSLTHKVFSDLDSLGK
ncbi:MAG: hypothetical protein U0103_17095 [Candidatus Obscuribacterales bacterium]|nr:MAG: hypothetical protein EKK48_17440 [Candidatus Melainabacteria bacterium]